MKKMQRRPVFYEKKFATGKTGEISPPKAGFLIKL